MPRTVIDTFERNLTPWVIEDACASRFGLDAHASGLLAASGSIGTDQIIRTADVPSG